MKEFFTLFAIIILVVLNSCLKDEEFKLDYIGFAPQTISDDWQISTPEVEGIDRQKLDEAYRLLYDENRFYLFKSMLVIKNGKLVAEAYTRDLYDINRIENIQSVTKTITSILTGIAFDKNLLDSVNQTLYSIYPEMFIGHDDKKALTIHQALSMKIGIGFKNSENYEDFYFSSNSVDYVLAQPIIPYLINTFNYNDGTPQLISYAIQKRSGITLSSFAKTNLFDKLGISNWKWEIAKEGTTFGGVSLYLKPRDLAKIGQMLLQWGRWKDETIVDSAWIVKASTPVFDFPWMKYGYYFYSFKLNGIFGFGGGGHGGQSFYVVPEYKLVVVTTAWPYVEATSQYEDECDDLFKIILDGCR